LLGHILGLAALLLVFEDAADAVDGGSPTTLFAGLHAAEFVGLNAAITWLSPADVGTVGDILDVERLLTLAVAGTVGHLPDVAAAIDVDGRLAALRRLTGRLGRVLTVAAVFKPALAVAGPVGDAPNTIVLLVSGVRVAGGVRVTA